MNSKLFNSRKFLSFGRLNNNLFYGEARQFFSNKDRDVLKSTTESNSTGKEENKTKNSLNINITLEEETNHSIRITKVHGNMTGMDKIDGMAGQTAGISSSYTKGDGRPEEGMYIYSGGLNLDKKNNSADDFKKTSKKD